MANGASQNSRSPSDLIDERIEELPDWRGERFGRLRALVHEADPDKIDEHAFTALVRAAVALNESNAKR